MAVPIRSSAVVSAAGGRARRTRGARGTRNRTASVLVFVADHALRLAFCAMFLAPVAWVVLTSLMSDTQSLTGELVPDPVQWSNYATVFDRAPLLAYAWNTLVICVLSTVGVLVSCVPPAYALAVLRWRGRDRVFVLVLATMMLPAAVTLVPLYAIFAQLGWIGSFLPLVVPAFLGDAFSIFLLRQFFLGIPQDLVDSARIDGAGDLRILWSVVLRLARPAIGAVAIFSFVYNWNDLFAPLIYLSQNQKLWTLSIALSQFKGLHHTDWNLTMAAAVLVMTPVILLFFAAQRVFIEGVTFTGVKG
jgi:multiple sugar transport system permease protein